MIVSKDKQLKWPKLLLGKDPKPTDYLCLDCSYARFYPLYICCLFCPRHCFKYQVIRFNLIFLLYKCKVISIGNLKQSDSSRAKLNETGSVRDIQQMSRSRVATKGQGQFIVLNQFEVRRKSVTATARQIYWGYFI